MNNKTIKKKEHGASRRETKKQNEAIGHIIYRK
jgi:hypothetical protein